MSGSSSHLGHAWNEFQQVKREEVHATVDPRMLRNPVTAHGPTHQVAPTMLQDFQEGSQATTLSANSWGHFTAINPSMWFNRQFPSQIQYSSSPVTLPFQCASSGEPRGLSDILLPISLPNSNIYSHESILESLRNDIPSSTQFQSGKMSSGPTFSNFVSPSISPAGSDASTAAHPAGKNVQQFDHTISTNGSLFVGSPWAGAETRIHNPGVSGQQTNPHHIIYDQPQGAVDVVNVSNTPYQVGASAPLPTDSRPTNLLGFPLSYDLSPPLTTAEKEWILSIALGMRASELGPEWGFEGPSFVAAPTSLEQDWQQNSGPSQVLPRQIDFASAPEYQPGSSSTVDELPLVNSLRTLYEQSSPASDLGNPPHSVPIQSAAHLSTDPGMFINFALQTDYQPTFITSSSELNAIGSSEQPTRIVRRNRRKRRPELELDDNDNQDAQHDDDDTFISVTCEWDGCGEQLVSMEGFREHFIKSGTGTSTHDLFAGNNSKTRTTCLWKGCHRPIACLWRHLWEVHGGFPRQQKRRRV